MKVFNLAEELEKERKKNNQLEERIDKTIDLLEYGKKASYLVTDIFINDLIEILKGEYDND